MMQLWNVSQTIKTGYEVYESAVIAAESEEEARLIHPTQIDLSPNRVQRQWRNGGWRLNVLIPGTLDIKDWAPPEELHVECLGNAAAGTLAGVVTASCNHDRKVESPFDFFLRTERQGERIGEMPEQAEAFHLRPSDEECARSMEQVCELLKHKGLLE